MSHTPQSLLLEAIIAATASSAAPVTYMGLVRENYILTDLYKIVFPLVVNDS